MKAVSSEDLPRLILDAQCSSIALFDMQSKVVWLNKSACQSSGRDFADSIGRNCRELWSGCGEPPCRNCLVKGVIATGRIEQRKMTIMGNRRWRVTGIPIQGASGRVEYVLFIGDDITEYLTIAKEARQNHKLQSLGTLAGGIAHDFNNILSGIVGYTELSLAIAPGEGPLKNYLQELAQAGKRATELVRQILTFSRPARVSWSRPSCRSSSRRCCNCCVRRCRARLNCGEKSTRASIRFSPTRFRFIRSS